MERTRIRGRASMIPLSQMLKENVVAGVFLDRDGVVNANAPCGEYITSPDDLVLLRGVAAAIRRVNELRVPVYIVTNQRWVAHRHDGIEKLRAIHKRLGALLGSAGAYVDGIYACVHEINQCACRKPDRGLVDEVLRHNQKLELASCVLVGDAETDIELASRCGMYSVRLVSYQDNVHFDLESTRAQETAVDLYSAVVGEYFVGDTNRSAREPSPSRLRETFVRRDGASSAEVRASVIQQRPR
jgi:D-glycero-D-manno-heptose 1,7-bisphosphate phosphatase